MINNFKRLKKLKTLLTSVCLVTSLNLFVGDEANALVKYSDVKDDELKAEPWLEKFDENSIMAFAKFKGVDVDYQDKLNEKDRTLGYRFCRDKISDIIKKINTVSKNVSSYDKNVLAVLMLNTLCGNKIDNFEYGLDDMVYAIFSCKLRNKDLGDLASASDKEIWETFTSKIDTERENKGLQFITGFIVNEMLRHFLSDPHCLYDVRQCYLEGCRSFDEFLFKSKNLSYKLSALKQNLLSQNIPDIGKFGYFKYLDNEYRFRNDYLLGNDIYNKNVSQSEYNKTKYENNIMLIVLDRVASIFGKDILPKSKDELTYQFYQNYK